MRRSDPAGDEDPAELFEELVRDYRSEVYRTIRRHSRNREDAEDLTQIAFLNAYAALRRGTRPELPRAWLHAIARNADSRRFRRLRLVETELDPDVPDVRDEDLPTMTELKFALRGLTRNQRTALLMREVGGLNADEIATSLGLTRGAVETLLFRARRALRTQFERALGGIGLIPLRSLWGRLAGPLFDGGAAAVVGVAAVAGGVALVGTGLVAAKNPHRGQAPPARAAASVPGHADAVRVPRLVSGAVAATGTRLWVPRSSKSRPRVASARVVLIPSGARPRVASPAQPLHLTPSASAPTDAQPAPTTPAPAPAGSPPSAEPGAMPSHAILGQHAATPVESTSSTVRDGSDRVGAATQPVTAAVATVTNPLPTGVVSDAAASVASTASTVTPPTVTAPTVTAPTVTAPTLTAPTLTAPALTAPAVTAPAATTPTATSPAVTTPAGTVPAVTAPSVTTPATTVPPPPPPPLPITPSLP